MEKELLGQNKRVSVNMLLTHFPIIGNFATTGHKLQGKTMDNLVVAEWGDLQNWAYVVLSRVRTLSGLFLWEPLPEHFSFVPEPDYLAMMNRLRNSIMAT